MDLNDLRYFALIVQHGGFTAAERVTHVHRSKLSRRMAQLEDDLGVRLLQRTTRRLALTDAGKVFYDHCTAMLIEAEAALDAVAMMRSEPAGTVRISCPVVMANFYVSQLIANFIVAHPKVRVELHSNDRNVNLIEERVDIAVRAGGGGLTEPGLIARKIATGRFILVASPAYLEGKPTIEAVEDVADLDTVGSSLESEEQVWNLVHEDGRSIRLVHRPRMLCSELNAQYQAAISGVGIALLPERIALQGLKYGALTRVAAGWSTKEEDIHLLFVSRRGMLPSVRALLDYLVEHLPETLDA